MTIYSVLEAREGGISPSIAKGMLNKALAQRAQEVLSPHHLVMERHISNGYAKEEEQENFLKADVIVFQFPIYWFTAPSYLKLYMEKVYESGRFWKGDRTAKNYGRGGFLSGKRYMFSVTMNGPAEFFSSEGLGCGQTIDSILKWFHLSQKYIGMTALPTFCLFNVYGAYGEREEDPLSLYESHLKKYLLAN